MDWQSLVVAGVTGGVLSQLISIVIGTYVNKRVQHNNWLRDEKYKVYSSIIELTSSTKPKCGFEKWPGEIRVLSQRIFLLNEQGYPSKEISDSLEELFQHAVNKRDGGIENENKWRQEYRKSGNKLRLELAKNLHDT